eukprot:jgi/Psemu1/293633/fgenesh1_pg.3039_\
MVAAIAVGGGATSIHATEAFASTTITPPLRRRPPAIALRSGERRRRGENRARARDSNTIYDIRRGSTHTKPSTKSTATSTRLQLFFNQRDEDGNFLQKVQKPPKRRARPTEQLLDLLRSPVLTLPRRIHLGDDESSSLSSSLVLRYMTTDDLKTLVPMCINEFCCDYNPETKQPNKKSGLRNLVPRWIQDPRQIPDLWEQQSFKIIVEGTFRLKLMQSGNSRGNGGSRSSPTIPNDPVMLVLCEEEQPETTLQRKSLWRKPKPDAATLRHQPTPQTASPKERLVGMVELSLQPPNADRNPPALPLPRWFRAALARHTTLDGSLQGWVTNLLVDDSCRGRGYSKILMAACEGIAKHSWGCKSMYLHADADISSGRIPQALYEGLGYQPVTGSTRKQPQANAKTLEEEFAWAGVAGKELERFTAIRMVDGVALLCYSKKL